MTLFDRYYYRSISINQAVRRRKLVLSDSLARGCGWAVDLALFWGSTVKYFINGDTSIFWRRGCDKCDRFKYLSSIQPTGTASAI